MPENNLPTNGINEEALERIKTAYGFSAEQVQEMPEKRLAWIMKKLETRNRPGARMQYELDALRDDGGAIHEDSVVKALNQVDEMRTNQEGLTFEVAGLPSGAAMFSVNARMLAPMAGLNANNTGWTALGPGNIGGRTRAIVIDPTNTNRIFASGVGGGVWFSADAGMSWNPTDDLMANLAVCSLVMDPSDHNTLYAGTGEGFLNSDAIRGAGIFKTIDGGLTWTQIAATATHSHFFFVNSLAISNDGQTLLAGTTEGIYRSTNAGNTWQKKLDGGIGIVAMDPANSNNAVAGGVGWSNTTRGHAYYSTDGGDTWQLATLPSAAGGRVQVCYAAADPRIVYASVDASPSQLWRSTDGGQSYSLRNALSNGQDANFLGGQGWYDNVIWAGSTIDPNLVIVGGVDLWRSTDGGNTLRQISTWWDDRSAHADHHVIVADPGFDGVNNKRVYIGCDGGIYKAEDVTTVGNNANEPYINGWQCLNNGYGVTQFYYGDGHVATNTIMGGTQDNGTLRYTPAQGVNNWNKVWGGDGGDVASDPSDPLVWYGEYVYLQIFRDTSGGAAPNFPDDNINGSYWNGLAQSWEWKPAPFTIPDARDSRALFIAPFELDPNEPNRLLGGGISLWRTDDAKTPNSIVPPGGPSWAAIKGPIGNDPRRDSISAIAIADGDPDVVVVGHANGAIFRSIDGTAANPTWQRIDNNGINANRQCLAVTIDPDDHDVIYATFGGFQSGNLWRTTDGGQSWTDLSGNLHDAPIRDITIHPQRSTWLYVATQLGVFASEDGGVTWSPANEGPANVACRDFFWLGYKLLCVTHGRGMFEIDLPIANAFPAPVLVYTGSQNYVVNGNNFTRYKLSISNRAAYPDSLFRPSPDLPPCGQNAKASRTWVDIYNGNTNQRIYGFCALNSADDLDKLWFALPKGDPAPSSVYVVLRDRRCPATYQSNAVNIAFGTSININSASAQEFEALPAIGPELAQRIVDHRQQHGAFATTEDIMNVSGIGPGRFKDIEELITV